MTEPTLHQILVQDPLSKVTRSERRNLLGIAIVAITIVKTGLIPTEISALGIKFSSSDRIAMLKILALVASYFLSAFLIYATSDFIDWRIRFTKAVRNARRALEEERARAEEKARNIISNSNAEEINRFNRLDTRESYMHSRSFIIRQLATPTSIVRAIFEFLLPIIIGIYSIVLLLITK